MKLYLFPIIVLLFLAVISVILGANFVETTIPYRYFQPFQNKWKESTLSFELDTAQYGLAFIIGLVVVSVIVGLRILGSGIADQSIRTLIIIIFAIGIWSVLSVLSLDILLLNTVVGSTIYIFLCLMYVIGVGIQISGSGGGSE
jgi:hypothetical protein